MAEAEQRRFKASEAQRNVRMGALRASQDVTLRDASRAWLDGAREGAIRNRSGDLYKPSVWRGYEQSLRLHLLPDLGSHKLGRITPSDLQAQVERWQAAGVSPSTNTQRAATAARHLPPRLCTRRPADQPDARSGATRRARSP